MTLFVTVEKWTLTSITHLLKGTKWNWVSDYTWSLGTRLCCIIHSVNLSGVKTRSFLTFLSSSERLAGMPTTWFIFEYLGWMFRQGNSLFLAPAGLLLAFGASSTTAGCLAWCPGLITGRNDHQKWFLSLPSVWVKILWVVWQINEPFHFIGEDTVIFRPFLQLSCLKLIPFESFSWLTSTLQGPSALQPCLVQCF